MFIDWPSIYNMKIGEVIKFLQTTDLDTNEVTGIVSELRTAYQQWVNNTQNIIQTNSEITLEIIH